MKILTAAAFQRARAFVMEQGRDLDRALLDFHFGDGTPESVLAALAAYQNDDGGFGHGLEPDLRTTGVVRDCDDRGVSELPVIGCAGGPSHGAARACVSP